MSKKLTTKYTKLNEGEGLHISTDITYNQACCDCGLVHKLQFFPTEKGLDMAAWRDERATAQLRRHKYGNLQHPGNNYKLVKE